jgi:hypothetical protein
MRGGQLEKANSQPSEPEQLLSNLPVYLRKWSSELLAIGLPPGCVCYKMTDLGARHHPADAATVCAGLDAGVVRCRQWHGARVQ